MAKLFGNLVGAPVNLLNTGLIGIVPPHLKDSRDVVVLRDYAVLNGNVIGDTISLGSIRSTALIDMNRSSILNDNLGAGVTFNIGDATYPSGLVAGLVGSTAGWKNLYAGVLVAASVTWPLWQRLGYAADPQRPIELLATIAGANPGNGVGVGWHILGRNI